MSMEGFISSGCRAFEDQSHIEANMEIEEDTSDNGQIGETQVERLLHALQGALGIVLASAAIVSLSGFIVVNSSLLRYSSFTVYTLVPAIYLSAGLLFLILAFSLSLWVFSIFHIVKIRIFRLDPSDKKDGHVFALIAGCLILLNIVLTALEFRFWSSIVLMMTILLIEIVYFDQLYDRIVRVLTEYSPGRVVQVVSGVVLVILYTG